MGALLLVSATWASIGCDSESFVPPRPEELRGGVGGETSSANGSTASSSVPSVPASGKAVEVILDRHGVDDAEFLKAAARTQGGIDRAKIKIAFLGEKESSSRQAGLVRDAVARHPLALIIEPADPSDPGLASAVREARDAGIPVVLLGRPLAGSPPVEVAPADAKAGNVGASPPAAQGAQASPGARPAAPLVLVTPPSFEPTAKQLVASAIRNTKNSKLDPQGGAVLLLDTKSDSFVEQRVHAVRDALKAAGIATIEEIRFEYDSTRAVSLLTKFLRANPKIVMAFSLDHQSYLANRQVRNELIDEHPLISAAFTTDEHVAMTAQFGEFAALAEYVPMRLIRKAVSTAINAAQGRDVPRRVEVPIVVHDSPENTAIVKSQGRKKTLPTQKTSPVQ